MKVQSAVLAIAALVLWLIPSGSLAQGKSGKSRMTICHIPPGNPDGRMTITVPEQAWRAHEAHGDSLGPCEGDSEASGGKSADDGQRAVKGKKGKKKDGAKARSGSDDDAAEDGIGADDRADDSGDVGASDAGSGDTQVDADTRARRAQRQAERRARREQRIRDRDGVTAGDAEAAGSATAGDAAEAEAGAAAAGTDEAAAAERRARRKEHAERRAAQDNQPDVGTGDAPEAEPGFFSDMKQFFGFGGNEGEEATE